MNNEFYPEEMFGRMFQDLDMCEEEMYYENYEEERLFDETRTNRKPRTSYKHDAYINSIPAKFQEAFLASELKDAPLAYALQEFSQFLFPFAKSALDSIEQQVADMWGKYLLVYYLLKADFPLTPVKEVCSETPKNSFFKDVEYNEAGLMFLEDNVLERLSHAGMQFYFQEIGVPNLDARCKEQFFTLFKDYYAYLVHHTRLVAKDLDEPLNRVFKDIKEHSFIEENPLEGFPY